MCTRFNVTSKGFRKERCARSPALLKGLVSTDLYSRVGFVLHLLMGEKRSALLATSYQLQSIT